MNNYTSRLALAVAVAAGVWAVGCTGAGKAEKESAVQVRPNAEVWQQVSSRRIFFGHQSVGNNILEGVNDLQREASSTIRVVDVAKEAAPDGPALLHAHVGQNGDPLSKIRAFQTQLNSGLGDRVDVAALKLCFWDVRGDADVKGIFGEYTRTVDDLRARFPRLRLVHITVPLFARDGDWRAGVRRLLGKPVPRTLENAKRHELSELLRKAYAGREPLFDLAAIEAAKTTEGGVPYLADAYTYDGGHLNETARRLAADAFLRHLAEATPVSQ